MSTEDSASTSTESPIIMTTVRVVSPFVLAFGLYLTFHGANTPGGGFQGGVVIGAMVYLLGFSFGIDRTRAWVGHRTMAYLAAGGVLVFGGIGVLTLALGGGFLEYRQLPIGDATKWGMEAVEIAGIAAIVAGAVMGLFFLTAAGYDVTEEDDT